MPFHRSLVNGSEQRNLTDYRIHPAGLCASLHWGGRNKSPAQAVLPSVSNGRGKENPTGEWGGEPLLI